jgi:hypothetical protein
VVEGPEGKRQFGTLGASRKIILNDLKEAGLEGVDWTHLAKDRDQ